MCSCLTFCFLADTTVSLGPSHAHQVHNNHHCVWKPADKLDCERIGCHAGVWQTAIIMTGGRELGCRSFEWQATIIVVARGNWLMWFWMTAYLSGLSRLAHTGRGSLTSTVGLSVLRAWQVPSSRYTGNLKLRKPKHMHEKKLLKMTWNQKWSKMVHYEMGTTKNMNWCHCIVIHDIILAMKPQMCLTASDRKRHWGRLIIQ